MPQSQVVHRCAVVALAAAFLVAPASASAVGGNDGCTLQANKTAVPGPQVRPKITLVAEPSTEVVNFGGSGGTKSFDVELTASSPLPPSVTPQQIELDSPKRFRRVGATLESTSLKRPTFSVPRFIEGRKVITFRVCVDATNADAGTYAGQVVVSGPSGLTGTSIATTVNAKNESGFLLGIFLALGAAAVLLIYKALKEQGSASKRVKILTVAVSLVAAAAAMIAIYAKDPAWGADFWPSFFALAGAAFGAAGIGSLITTLTNTGSSSG